MPNLPAITLTSNNVDAAELYQKAIYSPTGTPSTTQEVLNGGLDQNNWVPGVGESLPAWGWQYGTFAMGKHFGFDQHEYVYARQLGGGGKGGSLISERAVLSQLTSNFFIPWQASVVLFGVQAFFKQDATVWNAATDPPVQEFWDYRIEFGGTVFQGLYGRLPHARTSPTAAGVADPGYAAEPRWRYVSKFGMVKNVPKGHNRVRVSVWAGVVAPDPSTAKVDIATGGVWVLALR